MAERIFAKGLYFNDKHQNAPDFVLGSLSFKLDTLKDFIAQAEQYVNDKGYVKYQIVKNRDGKNSVFVDTYWLKSKNEEIDPESIPF